MSNSSSEATVRSGDCSCVSCSSELHGWFVSPGIPFYLFSFLLPFRSIEAVGLKKTVASLDTGKYGERTVIGSDFVGEVESVGSHVFKLKKKKRRHRRWSDLGW